MSHKTQHKRPCIDDKIVAHHRIPVIFFTVQKSADRSRTTVTKLAMKLLLNHPHNIYTTIADTLKARWKNVTYGCLQ
jgi:hypothetical protein